MQVITNILFLSFVVVIAVACSTMVFQNSGPIIIGSELNTNGKLEFLCLGSGCAYL